MSASLTVILTFFALALAAESHGCDTSESCDTDAALLLQSSVKPHQQEASSSSSGGCSSCPATTKCFIGAWAEGCSQWTATKAACDTYGGTWCVAPTPAPAPALTSCVDAQVDAVLLPVLNGMSIDGGVYTWQGLCTAIQTIGSSAIGHPLHAGASADDATRVATLLANLASFLAQSKLETGDFKNCDEANHNGKTTAPCTQRHDGSLYASLTQSPSCSVDTAMTMVAETTATWAQSNPPMSCVPGTDTAGCCWWGRGSIQTTGPHNYKLLQQNVVEKVTSIDVDLCTNPEAICQNDELKWLAGLYYWTSVVQNDVSFTQSLDKFVSSGFQSASSIVGGASFNDGTGGMVNNGAWGAQAHDNQRRTTNFNDLIIKLKTAGMGVGMATNVPTAPAGLPGCDNCSPGECYVSSWASPCFAPWNGKAGCDASWARGDWCPSA